MPIIMHRGLNYSGGSGNSLSSLSDVGIVEPSNGQLLTYNSTRNKWENNLFLEANPEGEPTDQLNTIQIGEGIYEIVGGGAGGSSFQRETIYSATAQADTYALSSPLTDFDAIEVFVKGGTNTMYRASSFFTIDELMAEEGNANARFAITTDGWYSYFSVTDENTLARRDTGSLWVYAIVGLKFGGGGGVGVIVTTLWNNTTGFTTGNITLSDSIDNYDYVSIWYGDYNEYNRAAPLAEITTISVNELNMLKEIDAELSITGYSNRYIHVSFNGDTANETVANGQSILRIVGIKFGGGSSGGGGGYSETSLYTATARSMTMQLSDDIDNFDAIGIRAEWTYKSASLGFYTQIPSSQMELNRYFCTGGEGRYQYIAKTGSDTLSLPSISGTWDGTTIITEIIGIKFA